MPRAERPPVRPAIAPYGLAHGGLEEFQAVSVRRYADGTVRAVSARWDKGQNKNVFEALADPTAPLTDPQWAALALLSAAAELLVDRGGQLPLW